MNEQTVKVYSPADFNLFEFLRIKHAHNKPTTTEIKIKLNASNGKHKPKTGGVKTMRSSEVKENKKKREEPKANESASSV